MKTKLTMIAALLIAAVGYLAFAGVRKGWVYYVDVNQLLTETWYQNQRVRLCGKVDEHDVAIRRGAFEARFKLLGLDHDVMVMYHGVVPDRFKPGCEVVLEGRLDETGAFQADLLMTKCASKYQAQEHAERLEARP